MYARECICGEGWPLQVSVPLRPRNRAERRAVKRGNRELVPRVVHSPECEAAWYLKRNEPALDEPEPLVFEGRSAVFGERDGEFAERIEPGQFAATLSRPPTES